MGIYDFVLKEYIWNFLTYKHEHVGNLWKKKNLLKFLKFFVLINLLSLSLSSLKLTPIFTIILKLIFKKFADIIKPYFNKNKIS